VTSPHPERSAILRATTELAAERGYAGLELAAIARESELRADTLRRYFATVEDAFCTVVKEGTDELLRRAIPRFAAQARWVDGLRAVAYTLRDFLREDPARARVMVVEAYAACPRSRAIREEGMAALASLIDLGRAQLPDPGAVPAHTAETTAAAIYNRIHRAIEAEDELSDEMVRELMYSAVVPYLGPEAGLAELEAAPS